MNIQLTFTLLMTKNYNQFRELAELKSIDLIESSWYTVTIRWNCPFLPAKEDIIDLQAMLPSDDPFLELLKPYSFVVSYLYWTKKPAQIDGEFPVIVLLNEDQVLYEQRRHRQ